MMKTLGQNGLNFIANKYKELITALSKKVDKIDGKSLSTNDYDNTAKSKVDAIPSNPKYTDTTYDLSQYAEKSDISRCKTKGYDTSSTWQALGTTRALEDWIGDFDKRTRELKGGGIKTFNQEISQPNGHGQIWGYKSGNIVTVAGVFTFPRADERINFGSVLLYTLASEFRPVTKLTTVGNNCRISISPDGSVNFVFGVVNSWGGADEMSGVITYVTSN